MEKKYTRSPSLKHTKSQREQNELYIDCSFMSSSHNNSINNDNRELNISSDISAINENSKMTIMDISF